ncbi:MAG: hypothetical protein GDA44_14275 [Prochloron sp. SP5CPC1]|nr:hypothetical protein [Candidatus Paraprochloron terpiosi SP5CPC1]
MNPDNPPLRLCVFARNYTIIEKTNQTRKMEDGATLIFGTTGADQLEILSLGNKLVFGGAGTDIIDAVFSEGGSRLYGGSGGDELVASEGDRLFGGAGNDTLDASAGNGNNRLYGVEGDDELIAGRNDRLFGGGRK